MTKKKLKKVNERVVLFSALILLAVFALGILFIANPNMTGNVVLEEYENQTSCENAGYAWENLTEQNCINISDCVECVDTEDCQDTCEECIETWGCNNLSYTTEADCVGNSSSWENLTEQNCINISGCVECVDTEDCQDTCEECIETWGCTGDVCDTDHLNLCDETNCTGLGYWYNGACHIGECVPDTCDDLGCGTQDDGCGTTLDCPACPVPTKAAPKEVKSSCVSEWQCSDWNECVNGTQTRTCEDIHNCVLKTTDEPILSQTCEVIVEETCFDGIKNQDEEGIDCGGVCEQKCSTLTGSAISPIESGKEFLQKNKTIVFIISGFLVLALAGFLTFSVLKKKKILPEILPKIIPKFKMLFKRKLKEEAY